MPRIKDTYFKDKRSQFVKDYVKAKTEAGFRTAHVIKELQERLFLCEETIYRDLRK